MSVSQTPAGGRTRTRAELLAELTVQKLGYSSRPWRLVDPQGVELYAWEGYPGGGGMPPIEAPVCFDRKRDAVAKLAELRAAAAEGPRPGAEDSTAPWDQPRNATTITLRRSDALTASEEELVAQIEAENPHLQEVEIGDLTRRHGEVCCLISWRNPATPVEVG